VTPPRIRHQSQTERDAEGYAAKLKREAAPIAPASDEDSMAHDIPVRKEIRAKRDTKERLSKLEDKHDGIDSRLSRMEGKLDTALSVILPEHHKTTRAKIDGRTKVVIAIVGSLCTLAGIIATAAISGCA
jgi:seryl-tRNA synthetase